MDYNIKSVERVFEIVKALSSKPQAPAELATNLNMNKSTVHRFISTLLELGYIEKLPDHSIRLSQSFINLGVNAQSQYEVVNLSKPYLLALAEEFKESALLAVFNGKESEYVDKVESSHAVRIVFEPGKKAPAYAVASGKVFLSSLKEKELKQYLDGLELIPHTKNTIINRDELEKEIAHVKKAGYAVDHEEFEIGLRGFACPIKDHKGKIIAAICIAGIAPRITDEKRIQHIISSTLVTAKEISARMGYQSSEPESRFVPK
ncbi:IclR family transcriptional regulator [Halobacillus shinanisalinarum]|uniref:IclR family transcriptional regulator n=1 Tax=Halobacillus shinanisalinarum TaxID=2932258 RepID=A0ABY4GUU6_9BACI|nr:IclR family transcriptional regulator [Halobacillus shinanisalinarum]UOQ91918.1 IclR family transcriptional regulator [Halobacillus shinanisalinarum]